MFNGPSCLHETSSLRGGRGSSVLVTLDSGVERATLWPGNNFPGLRIWKKAGCCCSVLTSILQDILITWGFKMKKLSLVALALVGMFAWNAGAYAQKGGEKPDLDTQFKRLDKDSDGKLTEEEFVGKREGEKADKAKAQFKKLDKNSDGSLSLEEFKTRPKKKGE